MANARKTQTGKCAEFFDRVDIAGVGYEEAPQNQPGATIFQATINGQAEVDFVHNLNSPFCFMVGSVERLDAYDNVIARMSINHLQYLSGGMGDVVHIRVKVPDGNYNAFRLHNFGSDRLRVALMVVRINP